MPYLSQEEIDKIYENDSQSENNSEKEESRDNFIDRKGKGTLVRVMRRNSIILYFIMATWIVINFFYVVIKTGYVIDLTQSSPFILLTTWLIVGLMTDKKEKLNVKLKWYKNKWGWMELSLAIFLFSSLLFPLFFVVGLLIFSK